MNGLAERDILTSQSNASLVGSRLKFTIELNCWGIGGVGGVRKNRLRLKAWLTRQEKDIRILRGMSYSLSGRSLPQSKGVRHPK